MKKVLYACWHAAEYTVQWLLVSPCYLFAMDGLTHSCIFKQQKLQNCEPIDLSRFVVDLRERHLEYWTPHSATHPREHNSKCSTYHQWCALPTKRALVTHSSYILPNICLSACLIISFAASTARFRLCVHTLRFETATESKQLPHLCKTDDVQDEQHACPFPLRQSPHDFSPQKLCISVSPNRSPRCVYYLKLGQ